MRPARRLVETADHLAEGGHGGTGRRILGDPYPRGEHAGVEMPPGRRRLAAVEEGAMGAEGRRPGRHVGPRPGDDGEVAQGHEGERHAGGRDRRLVVLEADLGRNEVEGGGNGVARRRRAAVAGKLRQVEADLRRGGTLDRDAAADRTDLLLEDEHDLAPGTVATRRLEAEDRRGADGRVAGEGELAPGREDADRTGVDRVGGGPDEDRLRQVQLGRDGLHAGIVEPVAVEDDGERIALQRAAGEDVEDGITAGHVWTAFAESLRSVGSEQHRQRRLCQA